MNSRLNRMDCRFRGVLGRENASLTEELTAELAGILSWIVGRVGPADPSGEFTEPISTIERKSPSLNFRLRVLIAPREACEDPQDLPSCTRQGSRAGEARSTNWNGHIMTKPISASEQGLKPITESGSSFLTRCSTSHRGPSPRSTRT